MPRILLFDSYDSFTYNLKNYLEQAGAEVLVVMNDEKSMEEMMLLEIDGLVISPGPKKPEESGILMDVLAHFLTKIPILGVCLGHQALGLLHGFKLVKAPKPMHGKMSMVHLNPVSGSLFEGIPSSFKVCRYHSLVLEPELNTSISVTAKSDDGQIMALQHKQLPVYGVQYHPEAILTQYGQELIVNWLKVVTLQGR